MNTMLHEDRMEPTYLKPRRVRRNKRPSVFLTVVFLLCAFLGTGWSAEKIDQSFSNVDEVVGWIKGKGKCGQWLPILTTTCQVDVLLPLKDYTGKLYSPGWNVEGSLRYDKVKGGESYVIATFTRKRRVSLSEKDPNAVVAVEKQTSYEFNSKGELEETNLTLIMKNFRGQELLNMGFPVPRRALLKAPNTEDFALLSAGFRFDWDWSPY